MADVGSTGSRVAVVGDRVQITADGYSEPKGSYARVIEVHHDHADSMTVRWEHLNGTCSLPVWQEHVEAVG